MRLRRLVGVAALALALAAVGCGSQPRDDTEKKDKAEEVYIFPDGTKVRGEAAEWLYGLEFPEPFWDLRHAHEPRHRRLQKVGR